MKITDVVIVADVSGSMGHLQTKQREAIWQLIQTFKVKVEELTIFVQSASNNRKLVEGQQLLTVP